MVVGLFLILGILPSYGEDGELEFFSMTNFPDRYWAYIGHCRGQPGAGVAADKA